MTQSIIYSTINNTILVEIIRIKQTRRLHMTLP